MSLSAGPRNLITDVDGILVGNAQDARLRSGVSVVLCETPAMASVDMRGGAPGTRDTDLLDPACRVERVDGICLSGGSAFGLSAADGVMRWLAERGRGVAVGSAIVPIVPSAILFDLLNGGDKKWEWPPYRELAYAACGNAGADFALGNHGAGLGARAGNLKGGLGSASAVDSVTGLQVGALVAVNAVGERHRRKRRIVFVKTCRCHRRVPIMIGHVNRLAFVRRHPGQARRGPSAARLASGL